MTMIQLIHCGTLQVLPCKLSDIIPDIGWPDVLAEKLSLNIYVYCLIKLGKGNVL